MSVLTWQAVVAPETIAPIAEYKCKIFPLVALFTKSLEASCLVIRAGARVRMVRSKRAKPTNADTTVVA